ncbi:MAG: LysR family transcriptional regulator, partial [Clostridia bacterium]|nr:LysR family transcriptional regulator [Clostridia bacterium]
MSYNVITKSYNGIEGIYMLNKKLDTLIQVIETGSFSKASEKLFISSTAAIKQINALEADLDMQLLARTHQGISPTAAGEIIYREAKKLNTAYENAVAEARLAVTAKPKMFHVGNSWFKPLTPFLDIWEKRPPAFADYSLSLVPYEDSYDNFLSEIVSLGGKMDFLLSVCDSVHWLTLANFLPIIICNSCVMMSKKHPLAKKKRLKITDFY